MRKLKTWEIIILSWKGSAPLGWSSSVWSVGCDRSPCDDLASPQGPPGEVPFHCPWDRPVAVAAGKNLGSQADSLFILMGHFTVACESYECKGNSKLLRTQGIPVRKESSGFITRRILG